MRRLLVLLAVSLPGLGPSFVPAAAAAMLGDATVPFQAERTVTVDGRRYEGPLYATPGHQRDEQNLFGMEEVFLLDTARKEGYLVLPAVKTYVEFPFPALMAELGSPDLTRHPVARQRVSGLMATEYQVDHRARDGSRAVGDLWVTRSGILVKLDLRVTRAHGGRPIPITMALSDIKLGAVDPTLFQLPPGLVQLPPAALQPLLGGNRAAPAPP